MILSPRVRFKSVMDVLVLFTSASDTFQFASAVVGVAAILVAGFLLWIAFKNVVLAPWLISNALQKQGVQGVPYTISLGKLRFAGNSPPSTSSAAANLRPHRTVAPLIAPLYYDWKLKYGDVFLFWVGYRPVLSVSNLEHMKEILYNKSGHFEKPSLRPDVKDVEGEAVSSLRGERWSIHRRIVSPAFFYDKLKAMTPAIVDCAKVILDDWESQIQYKSNKEVNVYDELKALSADIIARCAFGSSYEEGRRFFKLQQEQEKVILQVYQSVYIPGVRYLPTKQNRHAWKLKRTIEEIVSEIIEKRGNGYDGTDLLEILMDANRQEFSQSREKLLSFREIVDECKLFFYAGHETTSTLIAWTFLLLAQNPHWQEEARKEVLHVCGKGLPTHENLHGLKVVSYVIFSAFDKNLNWLGFYS